MGVIAPELTYGPAGQTGIFPVCRFGEDNRIGIDFGKSDVVIPIDIDITSTGVTITMNERDDGAIQIPVVGY